MFLIIAAVGKNLELGRQGKLIFDLPNDLKFFKEVTMDKKVFMGKKTFESLPKKLPNRIHYVLSDVPMEEQEDVKIVYDLDKFINENKHTNEEIFVIGGGMVYKQMLEHSEKIYLTEVDATCQDADTFFPSFNKDEWERKELYKNSDKDIEYTHVLYIKKFLNTLTKDIN